jgi:hypothetical protein
MWTTRCPSHAGPEVIAVAGSAAQDVVDDGSVREHHEDDVARGEHIVDGVGDGGAGRTQRRRL